MIKLVVIYVSGVLTGAIIVSLGVAEIVADLKKECSYWKRMYFRISNRRDNK